MCAAIVALAGCGTAQSPDAPIAGGASSLLPGRAGPLHSKLSGEVFSSRRVTSTCSSKTQYSISGTFQASGKAGGPYPGNFTAHGHANVTLTKTVLVEHFQVRSGSLVIGGIAKIPNTFGSPSFACSRSGELSFDVINLRYRVKSPHARGSAEASLGRRLLQEFQ
jgi:hypothetical protein